MKLAFLINSLQGGGAEKVLSLIASELSLKNEVIIFTLSNNKPIYNVNQNIKIINLVQKDDWEKSNVTKLLEFFTLPIKLAIKLRNENITTVNSLLFRSNIINVLSSFISKHKTILSEHSILSTENNTINKFLTKAFYQKSHHIIAVSEVAKYDLVENFKILPNKITTIYNPIDIEDILIKKDEPIEEEILEKIEDKFLICFVGRFNKAKNLPLLIKALSRLDDDIILILIGDGEEKKALQELSINLNLSEKILFLGWQSNPYKYIYTSDLFILPSKWESFGNVVIEALYCDTNVLTSDAFALKEINNITNATTLFKSDSVEDLVNSIQKIKFIQILKTTDFKNKEVFSIQYAIKKYEEALLD